MFRITFPAIFSCLIQHSVDTSVLQSFLRHLLVWTTRRCVGNRPSDTSCTHWTAVHTHPEYFLAGTLFFWFSGALHDELCAATWGSILSLYHLRKHVSYFLTYVRSSPTMVAGSISHTPSSCCIPVQEMLTWCTIALYCIYIVMVSFYGLLF